MNGPNGNRKHNTVGPIDNTIYFNILQIASGSARSDQNSDLFFSNYQHTIYNHRKHVHHYTQKNTFCQELNLHTRDSISICSSLNTCTFSFKPTLARRSSSVISGSSSTSSSSYKYYTCVFFLKCMHHYICYALCSLLLEFTVYL